ncbi:MAG: hypothetical protein RJB65_775 [Actinomycetota bacterium]
MSEHPTAWIQPGEVLLHVGVHKTGTTALQAALFDARQELRSQGVTYPGRARSHYMHGLAAIGRRRGWANGGAVPRSSLWDDLVAATTKAVDSRVIISGESFCEATEEQAAQIVRSLGGDRVKVVVTLRPLEQLLPSTWQQYVKAGSSLSYGPWLDDVARGPGAPKPATPSFWHRNEHARQVAKWVSASSTDRVCVVVVDPRNRMGLFEDFEDLLGLRRGTLQVSTSAQSNRGLSAEEVEMLRVFNERVGHRFDYELYDHIVRRAGFNAMVEGRRPGPTEASLVVPARIARIMREHGRSAIDSIHASGVRVVGNLALLVPDSELDDSVEVVAVDRVPIDAAAILLEGLVEKAFAALRSGEFGPEPAPLIPGVPAPRTIRRRVRRLGGRVLRRLGLRR